MAIETDQKLYCVSECTDNHEGGQDWVYFYCLANDSDDALELALEQGDETGDIFDSNAGVRETTFQAMANHIIYHEYGNSNA